MAKEREIRFVKDDFFWAFKKEGIDFDSLTDAEWRSFENMFMEGTYWSEVVNTTAAWEIAQRRKEEAAKNTLAM